MDDILPALDKITSKDRAFYWLEVIYDRAPYRFYGEGEDDDENIDNQLELREYYKPYLPTLMAILQKPELKLTKKDKESLLWPFASSVGMYVLLHNADPVLKNSSADSDTHAAFATTIDSTLQDLFDNEQYDALSNAMEDVGKIAPQFMPTAGKKIARLAKMSVTKDFKNDVVATMPLAVTYAPQYIKPGLIVTAATYISTLIVDEFDQSAFLIDADRIKQALKGQARMMHVAARLYPENPDIRHAHRAAMCDRSHFRRRLKRCGYHIMEP